eukprot:10247715-Alexandrium_andersonii.AAC.1
MALCPAFARADAVRRDLRANLLVDDSTALPLSEKLDVFLCCRQAHPGLCATADAWCWGELSRAGHALHQHMFSYGARGAFYQVRCAFSDRSKLDKWYCFAHRYGGVPGMTVFAPCERDGARLNLAPPTGRTVDFLTSQAAVGSFLYHGKSQGLSLPMISAVSILSWPVTLH